MGALFNLIRARVTARQVADMYGLAVNRHEKALCPWHADKHPSLSFDRRTGRCKCFACNAGGSAVDLAAALLHLSPLEAAKRIDADFGLNCEDAHNKPPPTPIGENPAQKRKREQEAESRLFSELCGRERALKAMLERYTPETSESSSEFNTALTELGEVQIKLEILLLHT